MHFPVFSTDCATNASHLEIAECRGGKSFGQETWVNILMPSLMAIHHLSHLMGLASPQMSTTTALRGPCSWGDKVGVPAANSATSLVASCFWGPCGQFLAVINAGTSAACMMQPLDHERVAVHKELEC